MKTKKFPLIAENVNTNRFGDFRVCFTSEKTGVVIECYPNTRLSVGEVINDWFSCFDKKYWRIITQPSEYPKEMYVSMKNEETALIGKTKATIVYKSHYGYITDEGQLWDYAVDIPEISEKEQKRNEILAQIDELYKSIEKL